MLQPVGKMFVAFAGYLLSFALQIPNGVRGHAHKGGPQIVSITAMRRRSRSSSRKRVKNLIESEI